MIRSRLVVLALLLAMLLPGPAGAEKIPVKPASKPAVKPDAKAVVERLPMTSLLPAKVFPGLCLLRYRVSTSSPECQTLFDQGLGFLYSYAWMEAARSF